MHAVVAACCSIAIFVATKGLVIEPVLVQTDMSKLHIPQVFQGDSVDRDTQKKLRFIPQDEQRVILLTYKRTSGAAPEGVTTFESRSR